MLMVVRCSDCHKPVRDRHWHISREGRGFFCSRCREWKTENPDWVFTLCKKCGDKRFADLIKKIAEFEMKEMREMDKHLKDFNFKNKGKVR